MSRTLHTVRYGTTLLYNAFTKSRMLRCAQSSRGGQSYPLRGYSRTKVRQNTTRDACNGALSGLLPPEQAQKMRKTTTKGYIPNTQIIRHYYTVLSKNQPKLCPTTRGIPSTIPKIKTADSENPRTPLRHSAPSSPTIATTKPTLRSTAD